MNTNIPMDPKIRKIINIVVALAVVLWLLKMFGVLDHAQGLWVDAWQMGPLGGCVLSLGRTPRPS